MQLATVRVSALLPTQCAQTQHTTLGRLDSIQALLRLMWSWSSATVVQWSAVERLCLVVSRFALRCGDAGPDATGTADVLRSCMDQANAWCQQASSPSASPRVARAAMTCLEYLVEEARQVGEGRGREGGAGAFDPDAVAASLGHESGGGTGSSRRVGSPNPALAAAGTPTTASGFSFAASSAVTDIVRVLAGAKGEALRSAAAVATATIRHAAGGDMAHTLLNTAIKVVCAWITCPLSVDVSAADGVTPGGPQSLMSPGAGLPSISLRVGSTLTELHAAGSTNVLDVVLFALLRVPAAQNSSREALKALLHPPSRGASDIRIGISCMLDGVSRALGAGSTAGCVTLSALTVNQDTLAAAAAEHSAAVQLLHSICEHQAAVVDLVSRTCRAVHEVAASIPGLDLGAKAAVAEGVLCSLGLQRHQSAQLDAAARAVQRQSQLMAVEVLMNHASVCVMGNSIQASAVAAAALDVMAVTLHSIAQSAQLQPPSLSHIHASGLTLLGTRLGLPVDAATSAVQSAGWAGLPEATAMWERACTVPAVQAAASTCHQAACTHAGFIVQRFVSAVGAVDAGVAEEALVATPDVLSALDLAPDESPFWHVSGQATSHQETPSHPMREHAHTLLTAIVSQWAAMLWGATDAVWPHVAEVFQQEPLASGTAPAWMHSTLIDALSYVFRCVIDPTAAGPVLLETLDGAVGYVRADNSDSSLPRHVRLTLGMQYMSAACCALRVAAGRLVEACSAADSLSTIESEVAEHGDSLTSLAPAPSPSSSAFQSAASVVQQGTRRGVGVRACAAASVDATGAPSGSEAVHTVLRHTCTALTRVVRACAESMDQAGGGSALVVAMSDALRALEPVVPWCVLHAPDTAPSVATAALDVFTVLWRAQCRAVVASLTHGVAADPASPGGHVYSRRGSLDSDDSEGELDEGTSGRDHPIVAAWLAHAVEASGERDGDASSAGGAWGQNSGDFTAFVLREGRSSNKDAFQYNLQLCCVPVWNTPASRALLSASGLCVSLLEACITVAAHRGLSHSPQQASTHRHDLVQATSATASILLQRFLVQLREGLDAPLEREHGGTVLGLMAPVLAGTLRRVVWCVSASHAWCVTRAAAGGADAAPSAEVEQNLEGLLTGLMGLLRLEGGERQPSTFDSQVVLGSALTSGGHDHHALPILARVVAVCCLLSAFSRGRSQWVLQHWQAAVGAAQGSGVPHPLATLMGAYHVAWKDVSGLVPSWNGALQALSSYSALLGNTLADMGVAGVSHPPLLQLYCDHLLQVCQASPSAAHDALRALSSAVVAAAPATRSTPATSDTAGLSHSQVVHLCTQVIPPCLVASEVLAFGHLARAQQVAAAAEHEPQAPPATVSGTPSPPPRQASRSRGGRSPLHRSSRTRRRVAAALATLREAFDLFTTVQRVMPGFTAGMLVSGEVIRALASRAPTTQGSQASLLPASHMLHALSCLHLEGHALPPAATACFATVGLLQQPAVDQLLASLASLKAATDTRPAVQGVLDCMASVDSVLPGTAVPLVVLLTCSACRLLSSGALTVQFAGAAADEWSTALISTCTAFLGALPDAAALRTPLEAAGAGETAAQTVLASTALCGGIMAQHLFLTSAAGAAVSLQPWAASGSLPAFRRRHVARMLSSWLSSPSAPAVGGHATPHTLRTALTVLMRTLLRGTWTSFACTSALLAHAPGNPSQVLHLLCPLLADAQSAQLGVTLPLTCLQACGPAVGLLARAWEGVLEADGGRRSSVSASQLAGLLAASGQGLAGTCSAQELEAKLSEIVSSPRRGGLVLGGGRAAQPRRGSASGRSVRVSMPGGGASRVRHGSMG